MTPALGRNRGSQYTAEFRHEVESFTPDIWEYFNSSAVFDTKLSLYNYNAIQDLVGKRFDH